MAILLNLVKSNNNTCLMSEGLLQKPGRRDQICSWRLSYVFDWTVFFSPAYVVAITTQFVNLENHCFKKTNVNDSLDHVHTHYCTHTLLYTHIIVHTHYCTHTLLYTHIIVHTHYCTHTLLYTHIIVHTHYCTHTLLYTHIIVHTHYCTQYVRTL